MPKLGAQRLEKYKMPSSTADDEAHVTVNLNFDAGTIIDIESETAKAATVDMMEKMIVEWNYTDDSGQVAPITKDNIRRMPGIDFAFLDKKIEEKLMQPNEALSKEEKKT